MNIKIEHKEQELVEAGSEVKVDSLRDILKIAQTHPIACISACCYKNKNNPAERKKATEKLETLIAAGYDYITVNGGWIEPLPDGNTTETTEESFIVIGPEYGEPDDSLDNFRKHMIYLCGYFHQWAVLYISWVEDSESVDEYTDKEIINKDDPDLTELYGEYLDGNGRTVKVFNNVNTGLIGSYFTTTARKAGAQKFTLLASTMRFYTRYVANSLANKYIVGWNSTHPIEEQREILLGGRGKYYYEKARETLNSYIAGETKWENGEYKPWKESSEKEK